MGNLKVKKVENGGVFIPWVLDVGHITEIVGPCYIIPVRNPGVEEKVISLIKECGLTVNKNTDEISIIG